MHHLLAQHLLAQLEHLRLPTNEVGLNLREFLRFPYMNDLASTHERIGEHLFSNCYGVLTNSGRLPINATGSIPRDRKETLKSDLALVEVLFCYFSYPVGRLHGLFGTLRAKSVVPLGIALSP